MAFRRKFPRARRRFSKPLARKRTDWVESLVIDPCARLSVPMCNPEEAPCCTTKWKMVLVDNQVLQTRFSDRATAVRIIGDFWFLPNPHLELVTTSNEAYNRITAVNAELFFGLKRGEVALDASGTLVGTPSADIWSGIREDLSEFQWMKTWHHMWHPLDDFTAGIALNQDPLEFNLSMPVVCNEVKTSGLPDNDFVNGTGTIAIETECHPPDCVVCPQSIAGGAISMSQVIAKAPRPWHVHFDVKKKIPLRENQELYLMMNGRLNDLVGTFTDFTWDIWGNMRTLIQTG